MVAQSFQVGLMFGGPSGEHDVSVQSARVALASLEKNYQVECFYWGRDGSWQRKSPRDVPDSEAHLQDTKPTAGQVAKLFQLLEQHPVDVIFLSLHGPFGEDGRIQGMLEIAGIPYTGSSVQGSALAMDKVTSKRIAKSLGLAVPRGAVYQGSGATGEGLEDFLEEAFERLGSPVVLKPVELGSSVATFLCADQASLLEGAQKALGLTSSILLEERIQGQELTCGVLEFDEGQLLCALPPTLIRPRSAQFFDFSAKYDAGATEELTPAPISPELTLEVQKKALQMHDILGLKAYSRADFIWREEKLYFLETNTLPGMTQTSLFPQEAACAGLPFAGLLEQLLLYALGNASLVEPSTLEGVHLWRRPRGRHLG